MTQVTKSTEIVSSIWTHCRTNDSRFNVKLNAGLSLQITFFPLLLELVFFLASFSVVDNNTDSKTEAAAVMTSKCDVTVNFLTSLSCLKCLFSFQFCCLIFMIFEFCFYFLVIFYFCWLWRSWRSIRPRLSWDFKEASGRLRWWPSRQ